MFNIRAWGPALLLLALFVGVMMMPSKATTPYKFLDDRTQAGNDPQRLLNTVVTHYGMTRDRLEPIQHRKGTAHQLASDLGGGIRRNRLIDPIVFAEGWI